MWDGHLTCRRGKLALERMQPDDGQRLGADPARHWILAGRSHMGMWHGNLDRFSFWASPASESRDFNSIDPARGLKNLDDGALSSSYLSSSFCLFQKIPNFHRNA